MGLGGGSNVNVGMVKVRHFVGVSVTVIMVLLHLKFIGSNG